MVEGWFRLDSGQNADIYSENLPIDSGGAPIALMGAVLKAHIFIEPFDGVLKNVLDFSEVPQIDNNGAGLDTGKWYYVAAVLEAPNILLDANGIPVIVDENDDPLFLLDENGNRVLDSTGSFFRPDFKNGDPVVYDMGLETLYIYDGTTVLSDSRERPFGYLNVFGHPNNVLDRVRLNGNYVVGGGNATLDDWRVFDEAFDPQSFLVETLGIPEPSTLAILGLGALTLLRRCI